VNARGFLYKVMLGYMTRTWLRWWENALYNAVTVNILEAERRSIQQILLVTLVFKQLLNTFI